MRTLVLLIGSLSIALTGAGAHAQGGENAQIVRAHLLWSEGQPKAAIAILEPMLQPDAQALSAESLGVVWDLLGSSYQDLDLFEKARSAYERAIRILRAMPEARAQYAAAINNLASLEDSLGEKKAALAHCEQAAGIYEAVGDHAGATVTFTNLAVTEYTLKNFKKAEKSLQRAQQEAQQTRTLLADDVAGMQSVRSVLALHDGRYAEALWAIQQAIDGWTRAHGPEYLMLGAGYILRGQALAKSGQYAGAIADMQHALRITEAVNGKNSRAYVSAEVAYAQLLRASGAREEASQVQKEASSLQSAVDAQECRRCTIDVKAWR